LWQQGKHRGVQTHAMAVKEGLILESKIEDLTPILLDKIHGRTTKEENIFFCPTGMGFTDAMVAWEIFNRAIELKIGTKLKLWKNHKWI
jgi:ornithine cyclodeaminase/alanine dehydrogenase-like protein (mu-crystallin family)